MEKKIEYMPGINTLARKLLSVEAGLNDIGKATIKQLSRCHLMPV
ncbi:MAG TPA: hypothetical protein VEV15_12250 [Flavisolibacter sp.]|nr:hypothetical protein [Flavisolibacter sp.]